jgi:hypothetical protein
MDSYDQKTNNLRKTSMTLHLSRPFVPDSRSKRLVTTKNQFPGGSLRASGNCCQNSNFTVFSWNTKRH